VEPFVDEQCLGIFRAQQGVKASVDRSKTVNVFVIGREIGLIQSVHFLRETNDLAPKFDLLNFVWIPRFFGSDILAPPKGLAQRDERQYDYSREIFELPHNYSFTSDEV